MSDNELIKDLLKKDNPIITENLKSIYMKEDEYSTFLWAIESSVIDEYVENNKIKDKELIKHLKNFLKNLDKPIDFFETNFEKALYYNLLDALEEEITMHELKLCINYILWSIDNRTWMNDSQAYVKWLTHVNGVLDPKESKQFEQKVRILCKRRGIPKHEVDAMLSNNFEDVEVPDKEDTNIESNFFAMDDSLKLDYVIKNFEQYPFLFELYYPDLLDNKEYDKAEKLCKGILEYMPNFVPIEHSLGTVYDESGNNILAKDQFEKCLKLIEHDEEYQKLPGVDMITSKIKQSIEELSKGENK